MAAPPGFKLCRVPGCGTCIPVRNFPAHARICLKRARDSDESSSVADDGSTGGDERLDDSVRVAGANGMEADDGYAEDDGAGPLGAADYEEAEPCFDGDVAGVSCEGL